MKQDKRSTLSALTTPGLPDLETSADWISIEQPTRDRAILPAVELPRVDMRRQKHDERPTHHRSPEKLAYLMLRFVARFLIEQLLDDRDEISGRKGLLEQNASGHALHFPPFGRSSRDVDNRNGRIDPARGARHFPAVDPAKQSDIRNQRAIVAAIAFEERHGLLACCRDGRLQAFILQRGLDRGLQLDIVLNDENVWMGDQFSFLSTINQRSGSGIRIPPRPAPLRALQSQAHRQIPGR